MAENYDRGKLRALINGLVDGERSSCLDNFPILLQELERQRNIEAPVETILKYFDKKQHEVPNFLKAVAKHCPSTYNRIYGTIDYTKSAEFPNNLNNVRTGVIEFVGRDEDVKNLHQKLQTKKYIAITTVVTGMAGVGKTELALQYALKYKETYPGGICWLSVSDSNVVETQLLDFATSQLGFCLPENWNITQKINHCWSFWPLSGKVLIVLDDVKKIKEINKFLPPQDKQRFKVLITTRDYWLGESFEPLRLEVLTEKAALELLISCIGHLRVESELEIAKWLCKWLGYLPLGLELVGRFLKRRDDWELTRIKKELEIKNINLPALKQTSEDMTAHRGIEAALELSWQELDIEAKWLGYFLSLFSSDPIHSKLIEQCISENELSILEVSWEDLMIDSLLKLNLVKKTKSSKTYQLHQLVRQYFRNKLKSMSEADLLKQEFCRLMALEAQKIRLNSTRDEIDNIKLSIPHLKEATNYIELQLSLINEKDLIKPLFIGLAYFYQSISFYNEAQIINKKGLDLTRNSFPNTEIEIQFLATQAFILGELDNKDLNLQAESLYKEALDKATKLLGENHLSVAAISNNLARLYQHQGRYPDAESLFKKALDIEKRLLGENHLYFIAFTINITNLYVNLGRYPEAEELYLECLKKIKNLFGEDNLDFAKVMEVLGLFYYAQGDNDKAEYYCDQVLKIRKKLLNPDHLDIANSHCNLGKIHYQLNFLHTAEAHYIESKKIIEMRLGSHNLFIAKIFTNLANIYTMLGLYSKAEKFYLKDLDIKKKLLNPDDPSLAGTYHNLAQSYAECCSYDKAEELYKKALNIIKNTPKLNYSLEGKICNNLGSLYFEQQLYTKAEPFFKEALRIYNILWGNNNSYTAIIRMNLAGNYYNQGCYEKAISLYLEVSDIDNSGINKYKLDPARKIVYGLAMWCFHRKKYDEAISLSRKVLLDEGTSIEYCLNLIEKNNKLAGLYIKKSLYNKAESILRLNLETVKKKYKSDTALLAFCLNNMATLYFYQELHNKAKCFFQELSILLSSKSEEKGIFLLINIIRKPPKFIYFSQSPNMKSYLKKMGNISFWKIQTNMKIPLIYIFLKSIRKFFDQF